jgi:hypothetical protein
MDKLILSTLAVMLFLFVSSCEDAPTSNTIDESLQLVDNVASITGAKSVDISLIESQQSFFEITFSKIKSNNVIQDGTYEGWCIDWEKPINSNGETYSNIQLFSTYNVENWMPINYLFNILDDLKKSDPEITFREVQIAIWSLRGIPEFNLDKIEIEDLPSRMHENGETLFSREKVDKILEIVEAGYRDFVPTSNSRFAVIAETPADTQTVITVVN